MKFGFKQAAPWAAGFPTTTHDGIKIFLNSFLVLMLPELNLSNLGGQFSNFEVPTGFGPHCANYGGGYDSTWTLDDGSKKYLKKGFRE